MSRVRNWCYTHNCKNPDEYIAPPIDPDHVVYMVAQLEKAPGTGQVHWQGYCQFDKAMRLSALKQINPYCHWEPAKGTPEQNVTYCTKADTRYSHYDPVEYGTMKSPGKRTDLLGFRDLVKSGARKTILVETHTEILARYPRFYDTLRAVYKPKETYERGVFALFGPSGCGKTRMVMEQEPDLWRAPVGMSNWYDGYDGQEAVLFDEFSGNMTFANFNQITDVYVASVPIKGAHSWWHPKRIYFTSNATSPQEWYDFKIRHTYENYMSMLRRFSSILSWDIDKRFLAVTEKKTIPPDRISDTLDKILHDYDFKH